MKLITPPELADGGYWYVTQAVVGADQSTSPGKVAGVGWCAWYANSLVAVRCPEPVTGIPTADPNTVDEILTAAGYTGKPYGRVGGS